MFSSSSFVGLGPALACIKASADSNAAVMMSIEFNQV